MSIWLCIFILGVVAVSAFILGVRASAWASASRCTKIKSYDLEHWEKDQDPRSPPVATTTHAQCLLQKGHDGPHCVILNWGTIRQQMEHFEDEPDTDSATDEQAH